MKKKVILLIPLALLVMVIWQSTGNSDEYVRSIEEFQEEKHDFFRHSKGSPFVQKNIEYRPVAFFDPNPSFRVNASLERLSKREVVDVTNTDGTSAKYMKFARASFTLDGTEHSLLILKALGFGNQYLTAFIDKTSGLSTYGGGRYLDLHIGKSDRIEIDFNKAYNPYCAYSADFLCPLPPRENFLQVSIEAGEKDYKAE